MFLVAGAGVVAGAVNAIVGSGSLVTFPTLLAVGFSPVVANVSNTVGLVFGGVSGAWGYRRELRGQRRRVLQLACGSAVGALVGGILLLAAAEQRVRRRRPDPDPALGRADGVQADAARRGGDHLIPATGGTFLTGIYGGYFGAAQGVILLAVLRLSFADGLQRLNAVKNVLAAVANAVAAVLFIAVADVAWDAAALIAGGSIVGAWAGARYGRRLPDAWLRRIVIAGGTIVAVILIVT